MELSDARAEPESAPRRNRGDAYRLSGGTGVESLAVFVPSIDPVAVVRHKESGTVAENISYTVCAECLVLFP